MNAADARTLLDYHYWARDRMLEPIERLSPEQYARDIESSFRSVRDTLVHVFSAEWIWYCRWRGDTPTAMLLPADYPDVETLKQAWQAHELRVRGLFAPLDDAGLARVIEYRTFAGQAMASALWHMLQHVVNHATYHRGQLTTMLRQLGAPPPRSTDLIAYYREAGARAADAGPAGTRT